MAAKHEQQPDKNILPFQEALEKTGFGAFNYIIAIIGGLVIANVFYETVSIAYIIPILECELKLTNQEKGILSGVGFFGIIVSSHLWGFLADTEGRRAVIVPTLFISFAVTLVSSFSNSFWMLVLLRFVSGFFISGASATIYVYVGELHIDRIRSRALVACSFTFSIGTMMLPIIAWAVINRSWSVPVPYLGIVYMPWRLFIVVCGMPGLVCGLVLLLYPESPKFLLSVGKDTEAIEVLKQMHKWNVNSGELKIDGIIPENDTIVRTLSTSCKNSNCIATFLRTMWDQTVPLFRRDFFRSTFLICTIQFWIFQTCQGMFMWFPYITNTVVNFINHNPGNRSFICDIVTAKQEEKNQLNATEPCVKSLNYSIYLYSLSMEIMYVAGFGIIGIIVNKVRAAHILFVILVVLGSSELIAVYIDHPFIALCLYILPFVAGVGGQFLSSATVELYPTHLRGMAVCISLMFGRLGGVVGSNINGFLLANNCEMTFYISGITLIVCAFLTYLIPWQIENSTAKVISTVD